MIAMRYSKCLLKKYLWKYFPGFFHKLVKRNGAIFSIGIYTGVTPFSLTPDSRVKNPVLTGADVTDRPAAYVADPFMIKVGEQWHMFFEVLSKMEHRGLIGSAFSADGLTWEYNKIVLSEPFHLAYPYVFMWDDNIYMVPDSGDRGVRIYKAEDFPDRWQYIKTILDGDRYVDTSIFKYKGRWWLFTATSPKLTKSKTLHCYFARTPLGPWIKHPASPIIENDMSIARPAGRVIIFRGKPIRFSQDGIPNYGSRVRAFEIRVLSETAYEEYEIAASPILSPSGKKWNAEGMHHIDAHPKEEDIWIACVDGWFDNCRTSRFLGGYTG